MEIRKAKVVDIDDPDKLSRIKCTIYPEMIDIVDPTKLEWIKPMFDTGSDTKGKHSPPEKDSYIYVVILDEHWIKIRYWNDFSIEGYSKYSKWTDITDLEQQSYPQPRFKLENDGSISFHNSESGEHGFIHNSGSYTIFDKDGNIFIYSKDKNIKLYDDNNAITYDSVGKKIEIVADTAKVTLDGTAKTIVSEVGTTKFTQDGTANTFKLEDGPNTIESSVTGIKMNNHLEVGP